MPNTPSAKRALKKSAVRREHNRGQKSEMRTWIKKTLNAVEAGDMESAEQSLVMAQKMIDKNVKWNQMHANTGARRKSSLASAVAGMKNA
ncbi:MAG: 30S ribosomal protein S20 [Planctomycetes bacterium]|nr:30S ribosomal protein S20 [Planctomycetota bacterium]